MHTCPSCASTAITTKRAAFLKGTSTFTGRANGVGAAGGPFTVNGKTTTWFADVCAPPKKSKAPAYWAGFLFVVLFWINVVVAVVVGVIVGAIISHKKDPAYKAAVAAYDREWVCTSCATTFTP